MKVESGKLTSTEYLFLIISLLLAPAIMLYFALGYFETQKNTKLIEVARQKLMEPLNQLKHYKDSETFFCATLNREFTESRDSSELVKSIEQLAKITGEQLNFAIWHQDKKVEVSNFLTSDQFKQWDNLIKDAREAQISNDDKNRRRALDRVKKLLGPHYFGEHFTIAKNNSAPRFIRADSAGRFPLIWLNCKKSLSAVVLFKSDSLIRDHRLKLFFSQWQNTDNQLVYLDLNNVHRLAGKQATFLKTARNNYIDTGREITQFGNKLVGIVRTGQTEFIANIREIRDYSEQSGRNTQLVTLISFFALIIILRSKPDFLQSNNISIKLQLLILLFICSGLPLISLALGAFEHLNQHREYLIRSAYQTCIEYIQEIDRRSHSELSLVMQKSYDAVATFEELIKEEKNEQEISENTFARMHTSRNVFRAVASSSQYIIAQNGIYKDGLFKEYWQGASRFKKTPAEIKMINDVGSYFLNFLNRVQINPDHYAEIELLTEMFYQKDLPEIVHDLLLLRGCIAAMGWGSIDFPVYSTVLALHDPQIFDFYFMAAYNPHQINSAFILRQANNIRRNEFGLNVFFSDDHIVFPGGQKIINDGELNDIFARIGTHPALEPQFCSYDKENWILAGFKGRLLDNYKILAMYPMSGINEAIKRERQFIVYSGMTALIILVSLTLLFGHSFTVPLTQLQTAAEAVEKREFGFRLPSLGRDEFGEMGRIFNQSIAELEELSIASIVQSRLMPVKTIESGHFDVFGRSVPMADLGGDYYDYFSIDEQRFAVLLGDVAGHGVGASLIMAMAKTAIVCCEPWHNQPLKVLDALHRLICTTRSKTQRKIMTFQYLCFDKTSGSGKYANAGGCSPILVCPKTASTSEVTLAGPVLGGFKKSKFSEVELLMQSGQALVLYTDGIIETKNPAGAEIGYDRFKEWLLKHYSSDADAYYNAVYDEYLQWLAGCDTQDDLTLIMLVYKGPDVPDNA
ncbi:MAG: SpoIIE family protein phosphatase [Candidatus Riflebacteria bacterium]|nr:SpoIIE family protein phosphatase [Candidatus Riflebacteria bacterium]